MQFEPEVVHVTAREATVIWYRSGTQLSFRCALNAVPKPENLVPIGAPMSLSGAGESPIVSKGLIETSQKVAARAIARHREESVTKLKRWFNPHQLSFQFH